MPKAPKPAAALAELKRLADTLGRPVPQAAAPVPTARDVREHAHKSDMSQTLPPTPSRR